MDVSLNAHNHDDFLEQFPLGSFLQSRFWQRFLSLRKLKHWQLSVYDNSRLVANCLLYSNPLLFGKSYLYAPKGPFILPNATEQQRQEAYELILSQIRDITIATRRREEIFCRLEPNVPPPSGLAIPSMKVESPVPATTIYLELSKPIEDIFASCKEKTRYNIRLAQKKGIAVYWSQDMDGLRIFLKLMSKSASRNRIRSHSSRYYELLLKAGQEFNAVVINWAVYENTPIAANLYIMHYPTMTYFNGGFEYRLRQLMAPYLLQWEAIKLAVDRGMEYYDLWGFTPSNGSKPEWEGFSRFKAGFNGTVVASPGRYDFIYNPMWYTIYSKVKRLRNIF